MSWNGHRVQSFRPSVRQPQLVAMGSWATLCSEVWQVILVSECSPYNPIAERCSEGVGQVASTLTREAWGYSAPASRQGV